MTPDEARKVLAAYEDTLTLRRAEQIDAEQSDESARAVAATEVLYQTDWHVEWLELHPLPKKGTPAAFDPRNRSRFARWLAWKNEQDKLTAPQSRRVYQLVNAATIHRDFLHSVQEVPEYVLRPFDWMRVNRYGDRIPEVWGQAAKAAGGADKVTGAHTAEAVREWKKQQLGTKGVKTAARRRKAEVHRAKALTAIRQLMDDGDEGEWEKFKQQFKEMVVGG